MEKQSYYDFLLEQTSRLKPVTSKFIQDFVETHKEELEFPLGGGDTQNISELLKRKEGDHQALETLLLVIVKVAGCYDTQSPYYNAVSNLLDGEYDSLG